MTENDLSDMKVAIVHDYLQEFGGAERVVLALLKIFPKADLYTSIVDDNLVVELRKEYPQFENVELRTPLVNRVPFIKHFSKLFTFFYPLIFENFDLREYDLVISSSSIWSKGVLTNHNQVHLGYIHTPPRFLYGYPREVDKRKITLFAPVLKPLDLMLRMWDYSAAQRPDFLIANSETVAERVKKIYRREAEVVYPPVAVTSREGAGKGSNGYFLTVSRLSEYKNVDVIIKACNELDLPLKVAGTGREESRLRKLAGESVEVLGFVPEGELASLYKNAAAVIFAAEDEDFGIVPVEAMGFGKPVIALKQGGLRETVIEGETGLFFEEPVVESLKEVLRDFNPNDFDSKRIRSRAEKFSEKAFRENILGIVKEVIPV